MQIRAVIFDMDGLMLDTEPLYRIAWKRASAECGFELTDEIYKQLVGRNRKDGFLALADAFGPGFPVQKFKDRVQEQETVAFSKLPISKKAGLDSLLAFLAEKKIPMGVATSTERRRALDRLQSAELLEKFIAVAAGDEVSQGKPFPDIFLLAASRLGVPPADCLVLEDAESGVTAAHQAGMQVYMVPDLVPPSSAAQRLALGIFDSLADVLKNLEVASITPMGVGIDLPSFRTVRLVASPLHRRDARDILEMHEDPAVMATLGGVKSKDEATKWMSDNLDHWKRHGFGLCIFRDARDGSFVGRSGLREAQVGGMKEIELNYAVVDKYWGMGFATEMARAILKIGADRLQLKNIVVLIHADNLRSRRVAEKLGFHFEQNVIWRDLPFMLYRLRTQDSPAK